MFEDATRPESATEDHIWKGRDALTHSQPHYSIINSNNDKGRELKQRQVCAMVRSLEYECEMNTIVQQVKDLWSGSYQWVSVTVIGLTSPL